MGTLWLRTIDPLSSLVPARLAWRSLSQVQDQRVCIVRPGGLGDLVLLTRALIELGANPRGIFWIIEKRNDPWAEFLGLPYARYDDLSTLMSSLKGQRAFECVVNSEQTFGLAALFSNRVTVRDGTLIGFSTNRRADLFDVIVKHNLEQEHELEAFKRLLGAIPANHLEPLSTPLFSDNSPTDDIAIVALAGNTAKYKKLSVNQWCALIRRAHQYAPAVALVGSAVDSDFSGVVSAECQMPVTNLVGKISFPEVVSRIRSARRLLSIDSGLVHVADFFRIPSDVIFTESSPTRWGATVPGSKILGPGDLEV